LTFHISYILSSQRLFAGHTGRKKSVKYEPKTSDLPFLEPTRGSAPFFGTKIMYCGHFGSKNKKITKNPCPPLLLHSKLARQKTGRILPVGPGIFRFSRIFDFFAHLCQQNPTASAPGVTVIGPQYVTPTWRRIGPCPVLGGVHTCRSHSAKTPL
jgi:hypothetical protein